MKVDVSFRKRRVTFDQIGGLQIDAEAKELFCFILLIREFYTKNMETNKFLKE